MSSTLLTDARKLATSLFSEPACNEPVRCLEREEQRPLLFTEQERGWTRRPFDAYAPDNMCLPCRAYWHAELAAQSLERWSAIQTRCAAEKAAKEQTNG